DATMRLVTVDAVVVVPPVSASCGPSETTDIGQEQGCPAVDGSGLDAGLEPLQVIPEEQAAVVRGVVATSGFEFEFDSSAKTAAPPPHNVEGVISYGGWKLQGLLGSLQVTSLQRMQHCWPESIIFFGSAKDAVSQWRERRWRRRWRPRESVAGRRGSLGSCNL